jgi:hypothetical protein
MHGGPKSEAGVMSRFLRCLLLFKLIKIAAETPPNTTGMPGIRVLGTFLEFEVLHSNALMVMLKATMIPSTSNRKRMPLIVTQFHSLMI